MTSSTPFHNIIVFRSYHLSDQLWNGIKQCIFTMLKSIDSKINVCVDPDSNPSHPIITNISNMYCHIDFYTFHSESWEGIKITKNIYNIENKDFLFNRLEEGKIKWAPIGGDCDIVCLYDRDDIEFLSKKQKLYESMLKWCKRVNIGVSTIQKINKYHDIDYLRTDYMKINFKAIGNDDGNINNGKFIIEDEYINPILHNVLLSIKNDIIIAKPIE